MRKVSVCVIVLICLLACSAPEEKPRIEFKSDVDVGFSVTPGDSIHFYEGGEELMRINNKGEILYLDPEYEKDRSEIERKLKSYLREQKIRECGWLSV